MGESVLLVITFAAANLAVGTEILSLVHALTPQGIAWFWGITSLCGLGAAYRVIWKRIPCHCERSREISFFKSRKIDCFSVLVVLVLITIVMVLLLVAVIAPPNTNDSLSYHMGRVAYWAQQGSIDFYTTPISRQLWMPPFGEWVMLHLYLLAGGDRWVNLVQWLAMVGSLFVSALLADLFLTPYHNNAQRRRASLLAALFCGTIPMGALQATSTQTDYVTAFWVLCLAYWTVQAHQRYPRGERLGAIQWTGLACSVGLGMLTKGTFYAFAAPFLLWLLISLLRFHTPLGVQRSKADRWKSRLAAILHPLVWSLVILITLNGGTWLRNTIAYRCLFGPIDAITYLANELYSPAAVISNLVRNSTLHLATPYGDANGLIRQPVEALHRWLGMDSSDPRTSLADYRIKRSRHEDYAGNNWHFFLVALLMLTLACRGPSAMRRIHSNNDEPRNNVHLLFPAYALALFGGYLLFSGMFKWQPTGSRLQLGLFVAAAPLAGCVFSQPIMLPGKVFHSRILNRHSASLSLLPCYAIALLLTWVGYPSIFSNPSRPLIVDYASAVESSLLAVPRSELLFINSPETAPGYLSLADAAARLTSCSHFGLILDSHDAAYPFWALQHPLYGMPNPRPITWIFLDDASGEIVPLPASEHPVCAIICTMCSEQRLTILGVGDFVAESTHFGGFILYKLKED